MTHSPLRLITPLFFLVAIVSGYFLLDWLKPVEQPAVESLCDLNLHACQVTLEGFSLTVNMDNKPLKRLQKHQVQITSSNPDFDTVEQVLEGRDMYMGVLATEYERNESGWHGDISIPVCTIDQDMEWKMRLNFKKGRELVGAVIFYIKASHS